MTPKEILTNYLESHGMKKKFFCEMVGINRQSLYIYLHRNGTINKFVAYRIEQVTNGEIKAEDLVK